MTTSAEPDKEKDSDLNSEGQPAAVVASEESSGEEPASAQPPAPDEEEAASSGPPETSEAAKETAELPEKKETEAQKPPEKTPPPRRKNQPTLTHVTARFAGCGRCSFFWAGYRVLHGVAGQETAVAHSKSGWLDLSWDRQMTDLIYKSFGVRLDIDYFHYEGCCKECRRHFVYKVAAEEASPDFRIEITPRKSR